VTLFPSEGSGGKTIESVAACRAAEAMLHFVDAAPDGWVGDGYKAPPQKSFAGPRPLTKISS
jgi:hypothetical protein